MQKREGVAHVNKADDDEPMKDAADDDEDEDDVDDDDEDDDDDDDSSSSDESVVEPTTLGQRLIKVRALANGVWRNKIRAERRRCIEAAKVDESELIRELAKLAEAATNEDPDQRPTMKEVVEHKFWKLAVPS